jgi:hypothetical protein
MANVVQIAARYDGKLIVLCADGRLHEQKREMGATKFCPVHIDGELEQAGRLVSLTVGAGGLLLVVDTRGSVYQQEATGRPGVPCSWKRLDLSGLDDAAG